MKTMVKKSPFKFKAGYDQTFVWFIQSGKRRAKIIWRAHGDGRMEYQESGRHSLKDEKRVTKWMWRTMLQIAMDNLTPPQ